MKRTATFQDLSVVLQEQAERLLGLLRLESAQLCIPTDGKGLRIRVSVPPGSGRHIPETIALDVHGETVEVGLELAEDYQDYRPHSV